MRSNSSQDYLTTMMSIVFKGGDIAMKYLNKSAPTLKKDASVITLADRSVSKLCQQALKNHLKDPAHLLIDEEDPRIAEYLDPVRLEKSSYLWALDPIDGTRLYANGMPMFGVSLGLLRELKPWLGVVYFPVLKELFYCDGKDAYFVKDAFSPKQKRIKIKPMEEELSAKSLFFCNDTFFNKFGWADKDFHIMINACAVVNLCWPSIGRGVGCFLRSHLWDFAGSWPIIQKAGLDFRSLKSGQVMERISSEIFNRSPKPWELKEYYLISNEKHYFQIKSKIFETSSRK